jgi:hypothetical protein
MSMVEVSWLGSRTSGLGVRRRVDVISGSQQGQRGNGRFRISGGERIDDRARGGAPDTLFRCLAGRRPAKGCDRIKPGY